MNRTISVCAKLQTSRSVGSRRVDDSPAIRSRSFLVFLCLALLCGGMVPALADDDEPEAKQEPKQPFVLPALKADSLEALEDFRKAVQKGVWDVAFKQLEKLRGDASTGLVASKHGLQVPLRDALAEDLANMPAAGQQAYRLFHDAEAKALWEQSQKENGPAEFETLSRLATLELITSVGDLAADRLGDLAFEQGDMSGAAAAWQRVLTHRPDSALPRAQLLAKIGMALAHAGRWEDVAKVRQQLDLRHAGETALIAGRRTDAAKHIAALIAEHQHSAADESAKSDESDERPDLAIGDDNEPVWQFRFEGVAALQRMRGRRWNMWDMDQSDDPFEMVMPAEIIGDTLVANWLGCDFGIDLETGKLRWRNGRFHDVAQRLRNGSGLDVDQFSLRAADEQAWLTTVVDDPQEPRQGFQNMPNNAEICVLRRDPATGKDTFDSRQCEELKQFVPVGSPTPVGNVLYLTAYHASQPTELFVLAIKIGTCHLQWATPIGAYQFSMQQQNFYGATTRPTRPTMLQRGARLYVDTQAGAVVELESATGRICWGCAYPSQMPENNNGWSNSAQAQSFDPSAPLAVGGLLLTKGMRSPQVTALSLDETAVAWKRSAPQSAMLAGADAQRIYLTGEEVLAIDRQTRRLLWSNRLPKGSSWTRPLITRNRYYQFTPRGVYELDKKTGEATRLFRGADHDSVGGAVLATSQLLITVSNHAITAYQLKSAPAADAATTGATAGAAAKRDAQPTRSDGK